jgi:hypothetical protein
LRMHIRGSASWGVDRWRGTRLGGDVAP